jgi:hypothetical protein
MLIATTLPVLALPVGTGYTAVSGYYLKLNTATL